MKKKNIYSIIFPSKKITIFIVSIFIIGIISGSLFLTVISDNDKIIIINSIKDYFNCLKNNTKINNLSNTLYLNFTYIILIFILGLSFLGVFLNTLIVYIKGFITGFTIASFIYIYKIKGLVASLIYIIPTGIINIIIIISISIYSILFSYNLLKLIIKNKNKATISLKQFTVIFIFGCIFTFFNSMLENIYIPNLLKIFIKLFT